MLGDSPSYQTGLPEAFKASHPQPAEQLNSKFKGDVKSIGPLCTRIPVLLEHLDSTLFRRGQQKRGPNDVDGREEVHGASLFVHEELVFGDTKQLAQKAQQLFFCVIVDRGTEIVGSSN